MLYQQYREGTNTWATISTSPIYTTMVNPYTACPSLNFQTTTTYTSYHTPVTVGDSEPGFDPDPEPSTEEELMEFLAE